MKKIKNITLIFISLILVFTLIACSKNNQEDLESNKDPGMKEIQENDDIENKEENIVDEVYVSSLEERVEGSDYITKVKLVDLDETNTELQILENIKGDLSQANLADIEGMEKDIEYLVFLRDVEGLVDLTDNRSLIILQDDYQERIDEIKEILNKN